MYIFNEKLDIFQNFPEKVINGCVFKTTVND